MSSTRRSEEGGMADMEKGLLEGLIEALANKHSQLDLNFQKVGVRVAGMQELGLELNGVISLSVHMREMTEEEKQALATKNVAAAAMPSK
jgi:dihydroorotase-like cyclic amidohydrolase